MNEKEPVPDNKNVKDIKDAPKNPPPAPDLVNIYVIPVGAYQSVYDCVRKAPEIDATPVKQFLESLQVVQVPRHLLMGPQSKNDKE